jgi:DICT domain-containing protein
MKALISLTLALSCMLAHADATSDRIAELKAEITQRQAVIAQMKADGKPTGRFEMVVFRLQRELEKLEILQ